MTTTPLRAPWAAMALSTAVLWLSGCDKNVSPLPDPVVTSPGFDQPLRNVLAASDASVPSATAVFPPGSASQPAPRPPPSDAPLSDAQESRAMPLPGQNNDHSLPAGPAKRASSP